MTVAISKAIRAALKAAGYGKADVSVHNDSYSMGSTVHVKIKRPEISLSKVEAIADPFARVDRDESGEILGGGNCFVDVDYADGALDAAAGRINEQVAAGRKHFGPCELVVKDPFTYQVWNNTGDDERDNVGRAGMHIDRKAPGAGLARELAKIGMLDTLDQWGEPMNESERAIVDQRLSAALDNIDTGIAVHAAAANDAQEPSAQALFARLMTDAASLSKADREALFARINEAAAALPPSAEDMADAIFGALEPALVAKEFGRECEPADSARDGAVITLRVCGAVYRISVERAG